MTEDTRVYLVSDDGGVVYFDNPQYALEALANGWHVVDRATFEQTRNALLYPNHQAVEHASR